MVNLLGNMHNLNSSFISSSCSLKHARICKNDLQIYFIELYLLNPFKILIRWIE